MYRTQFIRSYQLSYFKSCKVNDDDDDDNNDYDDGGGGWW